MPSFFPEGNTVLAQDKDLRILAKICALQGSGGGGTYIRIGDGGVPDTPGDTTIIQMVQNTDGTQYVWNPITQTWIQVNPALNTGDYVVDTIEDLRLVDDNGLLRYAITLGELAGFDGQARTYGWKPTEAGADNGISIVRPTSQAAGALGAWVEL